MFWNCFHIYISQNRITKSRNLNKFWSDQTREGDFWEILNSFRDILLCLVPGSTNSCLVLKLERLTREWCSVCLKISLAWSQSLTDSGSEFLVFWLVTLICDVTDSWNILVRFSHPGSCYLQNYHPSLIGLKPHNLAVILSPHPNLSDWD